jgi:hypothetical protein
MRSGVSSKRDILGPIAAIAGLFGLSAGMAAIALETASGVTQIGPNSYETVWADESWWFAAFLLFIPVAVAAWRYPRFAVGFVAGALVPQFALPALVIRRAVDAGWGDPLLPMGFLAPLLMTPLFGFAASLAARASRRS